MTYYTYSTETGKLLSWYRNRDDIIDTDGISVMDCPDETPNMNQKIVNGSLVVDYEKVRADLEKQAKLERHLLLAETDWWAVGDRTMTQEERDYRQALRDITSQAGFPTDITWPTKP